jgi:hypothetical protein
MCDFCGSREERESAGASAERMSHNLNRLAHHYMELSRGRILPHTDQIKLAQPLANSIIRRLVEDWV